MKSLVAFAHALADETRWRILQLAFNTPLCVCELADILAMPISSVSSHLQVIKKAGLLESEKCGKWIYYRVSTNHRRLLLSLAEFHEVFPASDPVLKADARQAARRLAEREDSCCPLPRELANLKPLSAKKENKARNQTASTP